MVPLVRHRGTLSTFESGGLAKFWYGSCKCKGRGRGKRKRFRRNKHRSKKWGAIPCISLCAAPGTFTHAPVTKRLKKRAKGSSHPVLSSGHRDRDFDSRVAFVARLVLRCFQIPVGSGGEKCRQLHHMQQIPYLHRAQFSPCLF